MQIILVHPGWMQDKHFTLSRRHFACALLLLLTSVTIAAMALLFLFFHFGNEIKIPFLQEGVTIVKTGETSPGPSHVKENMAVMTVKLGEMQARMMRLDSLGERVQNLAGIRPETFNFNDTPGRGGIVRAGMYRIDEPEVTISELQQTMDALAMDLELRSDYLNAVEAALMSLGVDGKLQSAVPPVNGAYNSSLFGMRADPFTGRLALHEGLDYAAPEGTPIVAAAGGVVVAALQHDQYGKMVDISHGNDTVTRYAHASRLYVKAGDIIRRGQHIADVGSTGRSTGAHLHFEVQVRNTAQDPANFLSSGSEPIRLAGKTSN